MSKIFCPFINKVCIETCNFYNNSESLNCDISILLENVHRLCDLMENK